MIAEPAKASPVVDEVTVVVRVVEIVGESNPEPVAVITLPVDAVESLYVKYATPF